MSVVASSLISRLAQEIAARSDRDRCLVAVDGVDGSGKTMFAEQLRRCIEPVRPVVVIHLDDFHNARSVRHARGRHSPQGFWLDSYDYGAFERFVLVPLRPEGDGRYLTGTYDVRAERAVDGHVLEAPDDAVVLVEGIFLHRDELASIWDASVFLDVPFTETVRRMAGRDGSPPDASHPSMRRYVEGQRLYFEAARPWERATWIVDNRDPARPELIDADDSFAAG